MRKHRRLAAELAVLTLAGLAALAAHTIDERADLKPPPPMLARAHIGLTASDHCGRGDCWY